MEMAYDKEELEQKSREDVLNALLEAMDEADAEGLHGFAEIEVSTDEEPLSERHEEGEEPDEEMEHHAEGGEVGKHLGFDKLERSIAGKGDVEDPAAVAAEIGREKYGKKKFQHMAEMGKK